MYNIRIYIHTYIHIATRRRPCTDENIRDFCSCKLQKYITAVREQVISCNMATRTDANIDELQLPGRHFCSCKLLHTLLTCCNTSTRRDANIDELQLPARHSKPRPNRMHYFLRAARAVCT